MDDEVLIRFAIADYVRECGYHVVEAADVAEALELLESQPGLVDLVFSDVQMPGEDLCEIGPLEAKPYEAKSLAQRMASARAVSKLMLVTALSATICASDTPFEVCSNETNGAKGSE